ncbi:DUF5666 domain-containing protein [Caldisericum sp.]|uniref:DUF5666 domain-containing protein n=1 Tax=Caldisericum sp. TaxID=2499687 RepID=UPI003D1019E0
MEKFEKDVLNFLEETVPNPEIKEKVMNKIKNAKRREIMRRNVFLGIVVAIIFTFLLSFVAPVFGKSGTLPQLIKSVRIESAAKNFEGVIEIDPSVLEKITKANLPFADAVVISALSHDKNIDIDKVIELRKDGYGWGKILDTLNTTLSEKDLTSGNVSSNTTTNTTNNASLSQNETEQNTNKNQNKNEGVTTPTQNQEKETETEQNENELIVVAKGTIKEINGNTLTVNDTVVTLKDNTNIKYLGNLITLNDLKVGDTILVHAVKDGDNLVARDIIVYKTTPNKEIKQNKQDKKQVENNEENNDKTTENTEQNKEQNKEQKSEKEYELNTVIVSVSDSSITLKDFENPVLIDKTTKVEQRGLGRVDISALKEGQTVQIHIRYDGTNYKATQIIIQTKEDSNKNENAQDNTNSNKLEKSNGKSKKP